LISSLIFSANFIFHQVFNDYKKRI